MILGSFFKPVKSISTVEVRRILRQKNTEDYCLLDVRQPSEYAEKHIPGAKLIPLGELQSHLTEVKANTLDLYLKLGRQVRSERARSVFIELSKQEKHHLDTPGVAFEKSL